MTAPPRRLRLLFPYTGATLGGSHLSSLLLAAALERCGHEVVLGLHQPGGPLQDVLEARGLSFVSLPDVDAPKLRAMWRQWGPRRRVRRRLASTLEEVKPDLVHSHDMRNHLIWSAATDGTDVPHIWHQRTPASGRHMAKWGARSAAFIAVSEFTRASLVPSLQPIARMIYNPFEPQIEANPEAQAALCGRLGVPEGTAIVGYIGNFSDRKRPEFFVEIAARMCALDPDRLLAFAMFGAPNEPHLSAVQGLISSHGLTGRVQILGLQSPFAPWMAGLSLLIAPARHEALGRTMIEAGFAGVPVVATDEGGNREIIEDGVTGQLIAPEDCDGFATAALTLLSDEDMRLRHVAAARARVSSRFSLESHLDAILTVYADVLGVQVAGR